jgi:hypothetical protein
LGNIGSLTFFEDDSSKSGYQGLFFKWGSLIGVAATGTSGDLNAFKEDTYLYIPDLVSGASEGKYYKVKVRDVRSLYENIANPEMEKAVKDFRKKLLIDEDMTYGAYADWTKIPYVDGGNDDDDIDGSSSGHGDHRLTDKSADLYARYKGDICKFLSDKKGTNGSGLKRNWVMPKSEVWKGGDSSINETPRDVGDGYKYSRTTLPPVSSITPENGDGGIATGLGLTYTLNTNESVVFPASGHRDAGGAMDYVGSNGDYWSSSVDGSYYAYQLHFYDSWLEQHFSLYHRTTGLSVRCVQEY